jgi:hypothetical protein
MELTTITNPIKTILSYGYIGFSNYMHFMNFKRESLDIKDRLNSYNMKYPITKVFNQIFLKETRIIYSLLIANFLFIISAILFKMKNLGYLIVLIFILNEFYFYDDILMSNISEYDLLNGKLNGNSVIDIIQKIPIDIVNIICLLFGVLFVTSKITNKINTNKKNN